jgi:hypothetical protein
MTNALALADLEAEVADLVAAVNIVLTGVDDSIAAAVLASQNEAIIPLANSVTYLITTQTLLINLLNQ